MVHGLVQVAFGIPILAGVVAFVLPARNRTQGAYALFAVGGAAALAASIASLAGLDAAGALEVLPALFFGIIGFGVFLSALYAIGYVPRYPATFALPWFTAAYGAFVIGMQLVVLAPSVLIFLLGWECMSIAAYLLILADGSADSMRAGLMYLVMTQLGFAAIASGMLLLAGGAPFAGWAAVASTAAALPPLAQAAAFTLLFIGFGSKAGLVPLHQWLPYAHPQAPAHVSALLSGVMLKVALFGFIEMLLLLPGVPLALALMVIAVGLASAFFGALHAAVEGDAKRLLAWSSIENMGLLFSALGIILALSAVQPFPLAGLLIAGAALFMLAHTLNHFLFKTSLFLAVGSVVSATHTRDLDALGGLARRWPVLAGVMLALTLGAGALPPSGTFFGEWAYLQTLGIGFSAPLPIAAGAVLILGVVGLVAGLALFAFVKLFGALFLGRGRSDRAEHAQPLPTLLSVPPALGALVLFAGMPFALPLLARLAGVPASGSAAAVELVPGAAAIDPMLVAALAFAALAFAYALRALARGRLAMRTTGTWDCGAPLTARMEQTATGFAAPIRFFFRAVVLNEQHIESTPVVPTNPWIASRRIVWSVSSFWERRVYDPLVAFVFRSSRRVRRLQGGVIQGYLFLMFAALILILALSL